MQNFLQALDALNNLFDLQLQKYIDNDLVIVGARTSTRRRRRVNNTDGDFIGKENHNLGCGRVEETDDENVDEIEDEIIPVRASISIRQTNAPAPVPFVRL